METCGFSVNLEFNNSLVIKNMRKMTDYFVYPALNLNKEVATKANT